MNMRSSSRGGAQAGFSLIEILVTLLILAIGLLGLAGLQTRMLTTELESFQRSQALVLAQDMVNRINANRVAARSSAYSGSTVYGTGNTLGDSGCGGADDLCQWSQALKGAGTRSADDGSIVGALVGARGCVETVSGVGASEVVLRVTVVWQGMTSTVAPSLGCGQGLYGADDGMRRAVSMLVTLAYLGS
ncbi:type IV pilus modification protein PilV [Pseudomonas stutzeri]|nr:type IV pilus modification protein PilV [Stutzerimonas stutzeri]